MTSSLVTPRHHLPEELMLGYANGGLSEAEGLLVATHAALCPLCARTVSNYESVSGVLLENDRAAQLSDDLLERTLALLDALPAPAPVLPIRDAVLPAPLARITGPLADIQWVKSLPNTHTLVLPLQINGVPVLLRRFRPGTTIPMHAHRDMEYDLILTGGVMDSRDGKHFVRGDVSANAPDSAAHRMTIDQDVECITLSVHAARAQPVGWFARAIFGYTGW